jgi:hypothetical protein
MAKLEHHKRAEHHMKEAAKHHKMAKEHMAKVVVPSEKRVGEKKKDCK